MENTRLYLFNVGSIKLAKGFITAGRDMDVPLTVPVPAYLITHPKGNVLFDTGMSRELIDDNTATGRWGPVADVFVPTINKGQDIVSQLNKLGFSPNDIAIVINSHLHLDHAGDNEHFPKAKFIVQRDEIRAAYWPEIFQRAAYFRSDFDHPLNYTEIDGEYDVFGDGIIKCIPSPGHTQGHQSLLVTLSNSGQILLPADAIYTRENMDLPVLPGIVWDPTLAMKSILKMRDMEEKGVMILFGHDPELFSTYKTVPEYYD